MTERTTSASWVNIPSESEFPLQNLPYGVFRRGTQSPRVGVAIGEEILDLALLHAAGYFRDTPVAGENVFARDALNAFLACGRPAWAAVRSLLLDLLAVDTPALRDDAALRSRALLPRSEATMLLPTRIGNYTDFYSSIEHATNVGKMFRDPENPLLPNWRHLPVGYHGRASSIVVSGTPIRRPCGQTKADDAASPSFGPSRGLDLELEVGFLTGPGNPLGEPIPVERAREHIFGLVLVNDWSARDIQRWEYVPLGPFLGKSFGTTISPWVVPLEALEPFRVPGPVQEPPVLPYLRSSEPGAYDLRLEIWIRPRGAERAERVSSVNFRTLYWSIFQQLAHQTSNGANVQPGDLYASGTVSGPTPESYGSLLELTWKGTRPLTFAGGVTRRYLEDGDSVLLRGWAEGPSYRVGFGECEGTVLPAPGT